jgi:hypothetical protein
MPSEGVMPPRLWSSFLVYDDDDDDDGNDDGDDVGSS